MSEETTHDAHSHEDIEAHVKVYIKVFIGLLILTGVTVAVAEVHLPIHLAVAVALVIAGIKGSLVAAEFMHLKGEVKWILYSLLLTVFMFVLVLAVPVITHSGYAETGWRAAAPGTTTSAEAGHGAHH